MLFTQRPANFAKNPQVIVTNAIIYMGRVLVLKRSPHKPHGSKWCLPGGKCEDDTQRASEALRELKDETGVVYYKSDIVGSCAWFLRYPEADYIYEQFVYRPMELPEVVVNQEEHYQHQWANWVELLCMNFIEDLDGVLVDLLT
ncbi:MAG: NUDIX hydrolase [bacterium]|nr:NUDIX hydrolase [bacterium]